MKYEARIKWGTGAISTITYNEPIKVLHKRSKRVKINDIWVKESLDTRVEGNNGYTKKVLIGTETKTKYINIENPLKINANKQAKIRHTVQNELLQAKTCDIVQRSISNDKKHARMLKFNPKYKS